MADTGELIGQIQHWLYQPKGNAGGFVLHCFKFGYLKSQCTGKFRSCVSFSQSLQPEPWNTILQAFLKKYLTSKLIIFSSLWENQKATNMCFWDLSWCWVEISCVCVCWQNSMATFYGLINISTTRWRTDVSLLFCGLVEPNKHHGCFWQIAILLFCQCFPLSNQSQQDGGGLVNKWI